MKTESVRPPANSKKEKQNKAILDFVTKITVCMQSIKILQGN